MLREDKKYEELQFSVILCKPAIFYYGSVCVCEMPPLLYFNNLNKVNIFPINCIVIYNVFPVVCIYSYIMKNKEQKVYVTLNLGL